MCSGNGACRYWYPSQNIIFNCTIVDVRCTPVCSCENGFGGKDCSLDATSLTAKDYLRYNAMKWSEVMWRYLYFWEIDGRSLSESFFYPSFLSNSSKFSISCRLFFSSKGLHSVKLWSQSLPNKMDHLLSYIHWCLHCCHHFLRQMSSQLMVKLCVPLP